MQRHDLVLMLVIVVLLTPSLRRIALGHQVRLIHAKFVRPFVKTNKNDWNDAAAICEAAQRPTMRFVATKSLEQQDLLALHRIRERLVGQAASMDRRNTLPSQER